MLKSATPDKMQSVDLLIFDDYPAGGVQRSAMAIQKTFAEAGYDATILTLREYPGGLAQDHDFIQCLVPEPPKSKLAYWSAILRSLRARMRKRPGVIVGLNIIANLLIIIASAGTSGVRLIASERVFPPAEPQGRLVSLLRYILYRRLDAVVSQTERTRDWFHRVLHLRRKMLFVIPNMLPAVQPGFVWRPREKPSPQVIACVGRFEPQKGFDYAVEILADCVAHGVSPRLLFVGDPEGDSRRLLEDQAGLLGVSELVEFQPRMSPLATLWPDVDILLFPSRFEGFPNVLAEAMAHGVPVVAFDCPTGPAELIDDGVNGFLVRLGDVKGAADRVRQLLAAPQLAARLGTRARDIGHLYSEAAVGELWLELIRKVTTT